MCRSFRVVAIVVGACVSWAHIAAADMIFSSPLQSVASATRIELTLTVTNPTSDTQHVELPDPLHVRIDAGSASAILDLSADEALTPFDLTSGGFRSFKLHGELPQIPAGVVTLVATGLEANPLVLNVQSSAAPPALIAPAQAPAELVDKPPVLALSVYDPVYFIVGGNGGLNAKFQISFKYRLFATKGAVARRLPWIDDLYLSYSQTSLWDLGELSRPFRDSSYRPRLFYANNGLLDLFDGRLHLGIEGGVGHESNGKDGAESRSVNIMFVRPTLIWGDPEARHLYVAPLVYEYLDRSDNPDIVDYRGQVDLLVGYGSKGGLNFWTTLRKGQRSDFGSAELNLSYPLSRLTHGALAGWLMLQYFDGYGESLLDYNRKLQSQLRLGLAVAL